MRRHNFKKLQIWQESIELVSLNYNYTSDYPDIERFGIVSQMNRSAVSIASNIAEGTSKRTAKHVIKFMVDSLGSAFEWETQLIISRNLGYITLKKFSDGEKRIKKLQSKISNFIDKMELSQS